MRTSRALLVSLMVLLATSFLVSIQPSTRAISGGWIHAEIWRVKTQTAEWHSVENWTINGRSFHRGLAWSPFLIINLTAYGTLIRFQDWIYFDYAEITPYNVTFYNLSTTWHIPFPNITFTGDFSPGGGEMSFIEFGFQEIIRFDLVLPSGYGPFLWYSKFWGLNTKPIDVFWSGTHWPEGETWNWSTPDYMLTAFYGPGSTFEVMLNWATDIEEWNVNPYTSSVPFYIAPGVPFMFIFGMIGLLCMFGGPIYGIRKIRKREYRSGFILAFVIFVLGFGLFLAWLWGGA